MSLFTHTVRTKANSIKFAHQSQCSPRISTLLKAIQRGFLKGCPNLTAKGITRYLNPSSAMAKGHMKWPHQKSAAPRHDHHACPCPHNRAHVHTTAHWNTFMPHLSMTTRLITDLITLPTRITAQTATYSVLVHSLIKDRE